MDFIDKNIILSLALVVFTAVSINITRFLLIKIGTSKKISQKRVYYVTKSINFLIILVSLVLFIFIWSVSLDGLLVFTSSLFAVLGVALFAQWSILSNLTSSIVIFFSSPARIGDKIKIVDGDNSIEGEILEMELFHIKIKDKDDNLVVYPNSLFLQHPVIKVVTNKG